MKGRDWYYDLGEQILRALKIEGEVLFIYEATALTRYANSIIHQNLSTRKLRIGLRARDGGRASVVWGDDPTMDGILSLVDRALKILKFSKEEKIPPLLPPMKVEEVNAFDEDTPNSTPEERAKIVEKAIRTVSPYRAFGALSTVGFEISFMNTLGHKVYHRLSHAALTVNVVENEHSGWEQQSTIRLRDIDPFEVGERARKTFELAKNPVDLKAGEYIVILKDLAVSELLSFLGHIAFSAKAYKEGRSFLKEKLGKKVFDERITIVDDPLDPEFLPMPFDYEGYPKRKHILVQDGVALDLVYDRKLGEEFGRDSTGHASAPFSIHSYPIPAHMKLKPGDKSLQDMISETERGVFITRLHYVNIVEPLSLTITGMTRDGTILIEDGKLKRGVKNMRFMVSVPELLNSIESVGKEERMITEAGWYEFFNPGGVKVPALKVKKFKFTGTTEF